MGCWAISKNEFLHAPQKRLKQKSRKESQDKSSMQVLSRSCSDVKKNHAQTNTHQKSHIQPKKKCPVPRVNRNTKVAQQAGKYKAL